VKDATHRILEELDHSFLNELPQFKDQKSLVRKYCCPIFFTKLSNELNDTYIKVSKVTAWESDSASSSYIWLMMYISNSHHKFFLKKLVLDSPA